MSAIPNYLGLFVSDLPIIFLNRVSTRRTLYVAHRMLPTVRHLTTINAPILSSVCIADAWAVHFKLYIPNTFSIFKKFWEHFFSTAAFAIWCTTSTLKRLNQNSHSNKI